MSGITVKVGDKEYTLDEAEKLGLLPKRDTNNESSEDTENEIAIIIDEEMKSFLLQVNDNEPVDIPMSMMVDIFEVSSFRSIAKIIEEDGMDDDVLMELATNLKLI